MAGYRYLTGRQQRAVDDRLYGSDPTVGRYLDGGVIRDRQYEASGSNMSGPELYYRSRGMGGRLPLPSRVSGGPRAGMDGIAALRNYEPAPSFRQYVSALSGLKDGASRGIDSILNSFSRDREQRKKEAIYNVAADRMGTGFSPGDPRNPINAARPERAVPAPVREFSTEGMEDYDATKPNSAPLGRLTTRGTSGRRVLPEEKPSTGRDGRSTRAAPIVEAASRAGDVISYVADQFRDNSVSELNPGRPSSPVERRFTRLVNKGEETARALYGAATGSPDAVYSDTPPPPVGRVGDNRAAPTKQSYSDWLKTVWPGANRQGRVSDPPEWMAFGGGRDDVFGGVHAFGDHRMYQGDLDKVFPARASAPAPAPVPAVPLAAPKPNRPPSLDATKQVPKTPIIPGVDPQDDAAMYEDPTGSLSNPNVTGATEIEAAGTKIATTPAEKLKDPNDKAIKKGFFENANMGMVEFGLRMASAASKPGATALGAAADAGVAMIDSKALRDAKKADRDFKESLQKGLIDARESEGKKDRKSRLTLAESEAKSLFARQRELLRSREETAGFKLEEQIRANKATEAYYLKNLASKSAGHKSASLNSQRAYLGELVKIAGGFAKADSIQLRTLPPAEALAKRMEILSSGMKSLMGSDLARGIDPALISEITKEQAETELGGGTGTGPQRAPQVGDMVTQDGVKTELTQEMIDKMPRDKN